MPSKMMIVWIGFLISIDCSIDLKVASDLWSFSKSSTEIPKEDGQEVVDVLENGNDKVTLLSSGGTYKMKINGGTAIDVPFSGIQSFYHIDSTYFFCPKGNNQRLMKLVGNSIVSVPYNNYFDEQLTKDKVGKFEMQCFYHPNMPKHLFLFLIGISDSWVYSIPKGYVSNNKMFNYPNLLGISMNGIVTNELNYGVALIGEKKNGKFQYSYKTNEITVREDEPSANTVFTVKLAEVDDAYEKTKMCYNDNDNKMYFISYNEGSSNYNIFRTEPFTTTERKEFKLETSNIVFPIDKSKGDYKILDFDFINGCPMYYFKIQIGSDVYWGEGDIANNQVIFLSKEPVEKITTYRSSTNGILVKKDGVSYFLCPMEFDTSKENCNQCSSSKKLVLDPTDHNVCTASSSGATFDGKYGKCNDNFFVTSNGCQDCETGGKYTKYSTKTAASTKACTCDSQLYIISDTQQTCTSCAYQDKYKDKDKEVCSDSKPSNSYWFNEDLQVYEMCDSSCKTCNGPLPTNCLSCDGMLGLYTDGGDSSCIKCPTQNLYRTETEAVCFQPQKNNFFVVSGEKGTDYGYIEYCHDNCETCSSKGDDDNNKCNECINSLYRDLKADDTVSYYHCVSECKEVLSGEEIQGVKQCVNCAKYNDQYKYLGKDNKCIAKKEGTKVVDATYNIIEDCDESCSECNLAKPTDDNKQCTKCKNDKYLYEGNCLAECEDRLYQDEGKKECINCKLSGKYKYLGKTNQCIEAPSTKFHESDSTYGIIFDCGSSCETCTDKPITGNDNCETCPTGKVFEYGDKKNCIDEDGCLPNYGLNADKKSCINCKDSTDSKKYKFETSLECVEKPSEGAYEITGKEDFGLLGACYSSCLTCSKGKTTDQSGEEHHNCDTCQANLIKTETGNCVSLCAVSEEGIYNGDSKCHNCKEVKTDKSPNGMYRYETGSFCIDFPSEPTYVINKDYNIIGKCHEKCNSCKGPGTDQEPNCETCKDGKYASSDGKTCVDNCDEKEGVISGACTNCKDSQNQYKQEGTVECVADEPGAGFYLKDTNYNYYKPCTSPCAECKDSDTKCTKCIAGKFLNDANSCVDKCPERMVGENGKCIKCSDDGRVKYLQDDACRAMPAEGVKVVDPNFGIIEDCHSNCIECSDTNFNDNDQKCTKCRNNYFLYKGNCFQTCDDKLYQHDGICTNCNENTDNKKYKYLGKDNPCIEGPTDKSFFVEYPDYGVISNCGSSCKSCSKKPSDSDDNCDDCPTGKVLEYKKGNCIPQADCLPNYGLNDAKTQCINCKEAASKNYKFDDSLECIEKPDKGYYDIDSANFGLIGHCYTSCETCSKKEETTSTNDLLHHCLTCKGNLQLTNENNCISTCPDGEGIYNSKCVNCKTIVDSSNPDGLYRYETDTNCIPKPSEPTYVKIPEYNVIAKCHSDCSECSQGPQGSQSNCDKCKAGKVLSLVGGNCNSECDDEKAGAIDGVCVNCGEKGKYKQEGTTDCVDSQPGSGYFEKDSTYKYYKACVGDCSECTEAENKCTECKNNKVLQYQTNTCGDSCPNELVEEGKKCINCAEKNPPQYKYSGDSTCKTLADPSKDNDEPIYIKDPTYNIIEKCSSSCGSCENSPTHCTSCKGNTFLSNNQCVAGCPEFYGKNPQTNKCEKCSDKGLYLDNIKKVCIQKPDKPFFVVNQENKVIELCYETCASCTGAGTQSNQKCDACGGNKYLQPDFSCLEDSCPQNLGKENNKCLNCKESNRYIYEGTSECVNGSNGKQPIGTRVKDTNNNVIEKCYSTCKECSAVSTSDTDQKCTACLDGYNLQGSNCIPNCVKPKKFIIDKDTGLLTCIGETDCPSDNSLLVLNTYQCTESCKPDGTCKECKDKTLYEYNSQCIETCPALTKPNAGTHRCDQTGEIVQETNGCTTNKIKSKDSIQLTSKEINNELKTQTKNFPQSSSKNVNLISHPHLEIAVFEDEKCGEPACEKYGVPYTDLTECISTLRSKGKVGKDEKIVISMLSIEREEEVTRQSGYYLAKTTGEKIDMSACQGSKVVTSSPIESLSDSDLAKARVLSSMGVDVYNPEDPFFNDFCYAYHDENKDVTLKDRREEYFKNNSLCEEGCEYFKVDFKTARVECKCEVQPDPFQKVLDNVPLIDFPEGLSMSNLIVVRCYNLVFDIGYIKKNVGFWLILSLFLLQIPSVISFAFTGLQPLYTYLYQFTLDQQSMDKDTENSQIEEEDEEEGSINSNSRNASNPPKKISSSSDRESEFYSPQNLIYQNNKKKSLKMLDLEEKKETNHHCNYNSTTKMNNFTSKSENGVYQSEKDTELSKNLEKEKEFEPEELNEMAYEDAKEYDHRCFFTFYIQILKNNMILISVFTNMSVLDPFALRIMSLILVVSAYFVFNGIFFSENYISNRFKEDGSVDFLYVMKNEITKSILASISAIIIQFLVNYLLSGRKRIETLVKRELPKEEFMKKTNEILKQMKCRIVIFFILDIILMGFFWYYVSAFCAVYQKTQTAWLEGCLITFLFSFILYSILYLFVTAFRYIGLKCGVSCFYTLSGYLI